MAADCTARGDAVHCACGGIVQGLSVTGPEGAPPASIRAWIRSPICSSAARSSLRSCSAARRCRAGTNLASRRDPFVDGAALRRVGDLGLVPWSRRARRGGDRRGAPRRPESSDVSARCARHARWARAAARPRRRTTWASKRGLRSVPNDDGTCGIGTPATYIECFEYFLAPYPVGGTPADAIALWSRLLPELDATALRALDPDAALDRLTGGTPLRAVMPSTASLMLIATPSRTLRNKVPCELSPVIPMKPPLALGLG